jgi:hypothetical protein
MALELFSERSDPNAGTVSIAVGRKPPIHPVMMVNQTFTGEIGSTRLKMF